MNVITCEGDWLQDGVTNHVYCDGTLQSIPYQDVSVLFQEYLAPDPEIIGLVSGIALTFFVIGVGAGRVVQIMRKV